MAADSRISAAEQSYTFYRSQLNYLRKISIAYEAEFQADVIARRIQANFQDFRRAQIAINELMLVPNVQRIARRVRNDPAFDLSTEVSDLFALLNAARVELKSAVPLSADGSLNERTWAADETYTFTEILAADLANVRTALIAVRDGIVSI